MEGRHFTYISPSLRLSRGNELQTDRRRDFGRLSCRRQLSGLLIDAESDDVIAVLIGYEQERARRIYAEIARRFATRRFVRDEVQLARALIDRECDDAVMAAVRAVNEPARRVDVYVGARIRPAEIRRQRRNGL